MVCISDGKAYNSERGRPNIDSELSLCDKNSRHNEIRQSTAIKHCFPLEQRQISTI